MCSYSPSYFSCSPQNFPTVGHLSSFSIVTDYFFSIVPIFKLFQDVIYISFIFNQLISLLSLTDCNWSWQNSVIYPQGHFSPESIQPLQCKCEWFHQPYCASFNSKILYLENDLHTVTIIQDRCCCLEVSASKGNFPQFSSSENRSPTFQPW